jgi:ketosteroid isomerase-like protein
LLIPLSTVFGFAALAKPPVIHPMTPQVRLIEDYNSWFEGVALDPDVSKLKAGLPKYITKDTVLREPVSLPWGGTMIGYDGWVHLNQTVAPVFNKILPLVGFADPTYYQKGNVVLREIALTIQTSKEAPAPFSMGIIEKYTVRDGRIAEIDEFYGDTASFLARLRAMGALSDGKLSNRTAASNGVISFVSQIRAAPFTGPDRSRAGVDVQINERNGSFITLTRRFGYRNPNQKRPQLSRAILILYTIAGLTHFV